ncbi:hypothetical protein [Desulfocurvus sp. DL9XJH121]
MPILETPFGPLEALPSIARFPDGSVRSCIAASRCPLQTPLGELVPQHTANTLRKRQLPALSFHVNGMLRTVPLEEQTTISTPLGKLPAEQVTLYADGALRRLFPLNGCLSGYWTQEDEAKLAAPIALPAPWGPVEAKCIAVYLSPRGALRSLTLWPDEEIEVPAPCGPLPARVGVALHDDGSLKSLEPARPVPVATPLGELLAFDPDAIGITGDVNSLGFSPQGDIESLTTVSHVFTMPGEDGRPLRIAPPIRKSPCDGQTPEPAPLTVRFDQESATFSSATMPEVQAPLADITVSRFAMLFPALAPPCGMHSASM